MTLTLALAFAALAAFIAACACLSIADMCKQYENTRTFLRLTVMGRLALFASFFFVGAWLMLFVSSWF